MNIKPSATAVINNIVLEKKQRGEKIYSFNIGEPIIPTHQILKDAALLAIEEGKTFYAPSEGVMECRVSACKWMNELYQTSYDVSQTLVTCGGKYGIFLLLQTLLQPQDEVLIISPYWVSYPGMVEIFGGIPVVVETKPEQDWKVTTDAIEKKCHSKTKLLIINNASNPTGVIYTKQELEKILEVAKKHNITVISDEVYSGLTYEGDFISCGSFPQYKNNVYVIQSCSKHFSMTGWRVGFVFADSEMIKKLAILQGQSITGTSTVSQWVARAALEHYETLMPLVHNEMLERRNIFIETWNNLFPQKISYPSSSLYTFIPTHFIDPQEKNSVELCKKILEKVNVALVPGIAFGQEGYVRFSFGGTKESIIEALEQLSKIQVM